MTDELFVNGSFEEGSEVATLTNRDIQNGVHLGLGFAGDILPLWRRHFADGMALYSSSADLMIKNSHDICYFGDNYFNYQSGGIIDAPDSSDRFLQLLGGERLYINLTDVLVTCANYSFEFDARFMPFNDHMNFSMRIGFINEYGVTNPMFLPKLINFEKSQAGADWFHYKYQFAYPFATSVNLFFIDPLSNGIHLDNLSLKIDTALPSAISVALGNDTAICVNKEVHFHVSPSGGFDSYQYTWQIGASTINILQADVDTLDFTFSDTGTFKVKLIVRDAFGCLASAEDSFYVKVTSNPIASVMLIIN